MTREELRDQIAMAICMVGCGIAAHRSDYYGEADAVFDALEAAGVRLVLVEELEDLLAGPAAWLDRWAEHVGTCWGGDQCACGLTLARHELAGAREALAASPYAPPGG